MVEHSYARYVTVYISFFTYFCNEVGVM